VAKRPPKRARLPLEDPRWRPFVEAHAYRARQTGDLHAAACDLTEALQAGRVPFKLIRPALAGEKPKAELGDASFWNECKVGSFPEGVEVVFRKPQPVGKLAELADTVFFVWWPVYKNIFGNPGEISSAPTQMQEAPETRGRKATYSYPDVGNILVKWLAQNDAVAGKKSARDVAIQFEQWCGDRGRKVPGSTQLRAYVRAVLKVLRAPPPEPSK
jgi:hypothetical protein